MAAVAPVVCWLDSHNIQTLLVVCPLTAVEPGAIRGAACGLRQVAALIVTVVAW